jgi:hypothetical protein
MSFGERRLRADKGKAGAFRFVADHNVGQAGAIAAGFRMVSAAVRGDKPGLEQPVRRWPIDDRCMLVLDRRPHSRAAPDFTVHRRLMPLTVAGVLATGAAPPHAPARLANSRRGALAPARWRFWRRRPGPINRQFVRFCESADRRHRLLICAEMGSSKADPGGPSSTSDGRGPVYLCRGRGFAAVEAATAQTSAARTAAELARLERKGLTQRFKRFPFGRRTRCNCQKTFCIVQAGSKPAAIDLRWSFKKVRREWHLSLARPAPSTLHVPFRPVGDIGLQLWPPLCPLDVPFRRRRFRLRQFRSARFGSR